MTSTQTADCTARELEVRGSDGHQWRLLVRSPGHPVATLLWLPALGVAARHYLPLAEALADTGVATFVHEWRGHGSSTLRAGHEADWGYRQLLLEDLPASEAAVSAAVPGTPRILGGHSLGGQLACCRLALAPGSAARLWLVGAGAPYWRAFPLRRRWWLPLVYRFLPWLADRRGALPGRELGFGGREARGVMRDWSRTALSGRYEGAAIPPGIEQGMQALDTDVAAVVFGDDWLAPPSSLRFLLAKLPRARASVAQLDAEALGTRDDHFAWMARPRAVADALVSPGVAPRAAPPGS